MDLKVYIQLIFLIAVNVFFTFSGIILNTLVIACLLKSSQLRKKLCNFMIMVLSCFDLASVITNHPLLALHLVFWINEKHDLVAKMEIYLHFGITAAGFSLVALLIMNIERYLGAYYPIFHRKSVTSRRLLTILAILILPTLLIIISTIKLVISVPVALIIFIIIVYPPLVYINYKLFRISRKIRRSITVLPEETRKVNLKSISTCLLNTVAYITLLTISNSFFFVFSFIEKSRSNNVRLSFVWGYTLYTMNSTFNSLIFFWKNKLLRTEAIKLLKTLKDRIFGS
jgi:hypothetical protein